MTTLNEQELDDMPLHDRCCDICQSMCDLRDGDGIVERQARLPCGHCFGKHCLWQWFANSLTCPTCRATVMAAWTDLREMCFDLECGPSVLCLATVDRSRRETVRMRDQSSDDAIRLLDCLQCVTGLAIFPVEDPLTDKWSSEEDWVFIDDVELFEARRRCSNTHASGGAPEVSNRGEWFQQLLVISKLALPQDMNVLHSSHLCNISA